MQVSVIVSILLDWRSAEVTLARNHLIFLFFDLVSVYNYISLLIVLTFPGSTTEPFSKLVWVHYFLVFVIYIGWNLTLLVVENADEKTKWYFTYFSIAEGFGAIIPLMMFTKLNNLISTALGSNISDFSELLIVLLSGYHFAIIIAFIYTTYLARPKP